MNDTAQTIQDEERRRQRLEEEAASAAAARRAQLAEGHPEIVAAARLLSVRPDDIAAVLESEIGTLIRTQDGVEYVVVPEDRPDAEGKVGLMYRHKPATVMNTFPAYASSVNVEPPPARPPGDPFGSAAQAFEVLGVSVPEPGRPEVDELRTSREIAAHLQTLAGEREELERRRQTTTTVADARAVNLQLETLAFEVEVLERRYRAAGAEERRQGIERADSRRRAEELARARAIVEVAPVFDDILSRSALLAPARAAATETLGSLAAVALFDQLEEYLRGPWSTEVLLAARALVEAHPAIGADTVTAKSRRAWRRR